MVQTGSENGPITSLASTLLQRTNPAVRQHSPSGVAAIHTRCGEVSFRSVFAGPAWSFAGLGRWRPPVVWHSCSTRCKPMLTVFMLCAGPIRCMERMPWFEWTSTCFIMQGAHSELAQLVTVIATKLCCRRADAAVRDMVEWMCGRPRSRIKLLPARVWDIARGLGTGLPLSWTAAYFALRQMAERTWSTCYNAQSKFAVLFAPSVQCCCFGHRTYCSGLA